MADAILHLAARDWAAAVLAGPLDEASVLQRLIAARGRKAKWLDRLAARIAAQWHGKPRPAADTLAAVFIESKEFCRGIAGGSISVFPRRVEPPQMALLTV